MKNSIFIVIFFCSLFSVESKAQKGVSIGALYSELSGLNVELAHSFSVINKFTANTRIAINLVGSYALRGGFSYDLVQWKRINLTVGLEYNYESYKKTKNEISLIDIKSNNLEFPLLIRYELSNAIDIIGGIVPARNLNNTENSRLIDNMRVGVKYKW